MPIAEFTLGSALLTVLSIFVFMAWLLVLFTILNDLFRDHSLSHWAKAAWVLFLIFIPFLTALVYLVARGNGMRERAIKASDDMRAAAIHAGAVSRADEITKLAKLRDDKTITPEEFERMKAGIVSS